LFNQDKLRYRADEILLQQQQLYNLPRASPTEVEGVMSFLQDKTQHGVHGDGEEEQEWLDDLEKSVWGLDGKTPIENDLVNLSGSEEAPGKFTTLLREHIIVHFHRVFAKKRGVDLEFGKPVYSGETLNDISLKVAVVLSSVLPTGSIFALHFITPPIWRLAFISLWAVLFSSCLAFFTEAGRTEIFSASVAMAAVQVVFVGTSGTGSR
jgi:hypothetical protein